MLGLKAPGIPELRVIAQCGAQAENHAPRSVKLEGGGGGGGNRGWALPSSRRGQLCVVGSETYISNKFQGVAAATCLRPHPGDHGPTAKLLPCR